MLSGLNQTVGGIMGGVSILVWMIAGCVVIGGLLWLRWYNRQFKYLVKLKVMRHNDFVYWEDKARLVEEDGSRYWKLRKLKVLAQIPPSDSTYTDTLGRFVAEGYYSRDAGVFWSRDKITRAKFQKLEDDILEAQLDPTKKKPVSVIEAEYQPLTTSQRALQANQITRAIERKGKSWLQFLMPLAFGLMAIILCFLVFVFWDKISKPVMDLSAQNVEISNNNAEIQQQNLRLYMMLTGGKGNGSYIVQQIPSDDAVFGVPSVAKQVNLAGAE